MQEGYTLSEEAVKDIDELIEFGENKFGNSQAVKYLIALAQEFERLADNPEIGRKRNEIKPGLYSKNHISHIIFYRKLDTKIRIVRVLYGGRDLMKIFD